MTRQLYAAIYVSIALHFLRMTANRAIRPTRKLVMPPPEPDGERFRFSLAVSVETPGSFEVFLVNKACTAELTPGQFDWLFREMYIRSAELDTETMASCAKVRLVVWNIHGQKPSITALTLATRIHLPLDRIGSFLDRFHSLVSQFNQAVTR